MVKSDDVFLFLQEHFIRVSKGFFHTKTGEKLYVNELMSYTNAYFKNKCVYKYSDLSQYVKEWLENNQDPNQFGIELLNSMLDSWKFFNEIERGSRVSLVKCYDEFNANVTACSFRQFLHKLKEWIKENGYVYYESVKHGEKCIFITKKD